MNTVSKTPVGSYYERHHVDGGRLRQSFMEETRKNLFRDWIGTNRTALDLGGRDGSLTRHFIDGNRVVLGDIDCAALQYARETYGIETAEINLNEPLPLEDGSFDAVVMAEVIEHLPYLGFTLDEVKRVLKPNGQFIGSIPLAFHLKDRWQVLRGRKLWMMGDRTHLQFFTYDEFLDFLRTRFDVAEVSILKGGRKAERWPRLFARDIAFRCIKP